MNRYYRFRMWWRCETRKLNDWYFRNAGLYPPIVQPQPPDAVTAAMAAELDEHGYEDDDEKRWMVAQHFAQVAIAAFNKAGDQ